MAADIFGGRMHGDRGAMLDRLAQHRAGGVVHDQGHAELVADFRDLGDREHRQLRVRQRLAVVAARFGVGGAAEVLGIGGIDEAALDAHRAQRVLEQVPGAAIDVGRADEIIAGVADVLHREQRSGLPRRQRKRGDAAFERGDALFQHRLRRVHDAGVDVAELLQREQVAGMFGRIELVGRRLIDRHRHRFGRRVGAIAAAVQHDGFRVLALSRHGFSASLRDGWCKFVCLSAGWFRQPALFRRRPELAIGGPADPRRGRTPAKPSRDRRRARCARRFAG